MSHIKPHYPSSGPVVGSAAEGSRFLVQLSVVLEDHTHVLEHVGLNSQIVEAPAS